MLELIAFMMQHALWSYIDSEINHSRQFTIIQFVNKGIEFINLPNIFKVNMLSLLFLLILKIRNHILLVIGIYL